jgi:hypothetical protein
MQPWSVRHLAHRIEKHRPQRTNTAFVLTLALLAGGCASNGLPSLASGVSKIETSAAGTAADRVAEAYETATTVAGDPTSTYTLVARGIHACWFGGAGPLGNSHVFRAEAQSPTKGGQAEIIIHERDVALADQRGPQALRITFENNGGVVRVATRVLKVPTGYAEPMTRDVETWAKGGSGCQLRASFPQPSATTAVEKIPGKPSTKPSAKGTR